MENTEQDNVICKKVDYRMCMGETYAFVTCLADSKNGEGMEEKKYWGPVTQRNNPEEIKHVMEYGSEWDNLP